MKPKTKESLGKMNSLTSTPQMRGRVNGKRPVRRVVRKTRAGSSGESLPPLMSIWAENAAGVGSKVKEVKQKKGTGSGPIVKGPRAVVPAEQKSLMRKKSKPLLMNPTFDDEKEDIVGKFKKIHPKHGKKLERDRFESSNARDVFRSRHLGSMLSPKGSRTRRSRVNPSMMSVAEQKREDMPVTFEYDMTMYNSPHSRGMQVGKHEVRLIPHPCIPEDDIRILTYIEGRATEPEIPPETTRDYLNTEFEDLPAGPPPVAPPRRTKVEAQAEKARAHFLRTDAPPVPPRLPTTPRPAATRIATTRTAPAVPERRPEERKSEKVDEKKLTSSLKKSDSVKSLHKKKKP